jgi:aminoglycoside phosphotransferase (APT) family kinase protein
VKRSNLAPNVPRFHRDSLSPCGFLAMTHPMPNASDLPLGRLDAWLRGHVEGFRGPVTAERFAGGQSNPTYLLDAASGRYVLRRKPPGPLLPSAHAVDREFRVMRALADTPVPVPRVYALCEDDGVIGSAFFVMEFLDGRIFWDQRLPEIGDPAERGAMFDSINAVIAALHSVDYNAVGLGDFGRPGNYMGRQIARWSRQYRASETETIAAMDRLIEWLPQHLPEESAPAVVHGDYRMDNLVFHKNEPRVIGVLDWELSTIGDPLADFAYHVMTWRVTPELFRGLAGIDFAAAGIPDEAAYVASYCRRTGRDSIPAWEFYMVYSLFRIAAILQGIAKRAIDGTAASTEAGEVGRIARPLAEQAWALAQSLRT